MDGMSLDVISSRVMPLSVISNIFQYNVTRRHVPRCNIMQSDVPRCNVNQVMFLAVISSRGISLTKMSHEWDVPRCNIKQSDVPFYNIKQRDIFQYNVTRRHAPRCNIMQSDVPRCNVNQSDVPRCNIKQEDVSRCNIRVMSLAVYLSFNIMSHTLVVTSCRWSLAVMSIRVMFLDVISSRGISLTIMSHGWDVPRCNIKQSDAPFCNIK
ncbi:unnamed protein product [Acanthosepion pharaonis]|uniref:Uncharacterized protein n=1 Tax=Acanthosepion pharaonis TaxID=158019 RepID=A0A812D547_ACAPH|nr:unnamed protein product [Sepia pharaonis]